MAQIHSPVPLPSAADPDVDPMLETTLIKALAKDPDDRHQSSVELVQALSAISGTESVEEATSDPAPPEVPMVGPETVATPPPGPATAPAPRQSPEPSDAPSVACAFRPMANAGTWHRSRGGCGGDRATRLRCTQLGPSRGHGSAIISGRSASCRSTGIRSGEYTDASRSPEPNSSAAGGRRSAHRHSDATRQPSPNTSSGGYAGL